MSLASVPVCDGLWKYNPANGMGWALVSLRLTENTFGNNFWTSLFRKQCEMFTRKHLIVFCLYYFSIMSHKPAFLLVGKTIFTGINYIIIKFTSLALVDVVSFVYLCLQLFSSPPDITRRFNLIPYLLYVAYSRSSWLSPFFYKKSAL